MPPKKKNNKEKPPPKKRGRKPKPKSDIPEIISKIMNMTKVPRAHFCSSPEFPIIMLQNCLLRGLDLPNDL